VFQRVLRVQTGPNEHSSEKIQSLNENRPGSVTSKPAGTYQIATSTMECVRLRSYVNFLWHVLQRTRRRTTFPHFGHRAVDRDL
jgi:hypothetical protein